MWGTSDGMLKTVLRDVDHRNGGENGKKMGIGAKCEIEDVALSFAEPAAENLAPRGGLHCRR
jgi:hypothetical protein